MKPTDEVHKPSIPFLMDEPFGDGTPIDEKSLVMLAKNRSDRLTCFPNHHIFLYWIGTFIIKGEVTIVGDKKYISQTFDTTNDAEFFLSEEILKIFTFIQNNQQMKGELPGMESLSSFYQKLYIATPDTIKTKVTRTSVTIEIELTSEIEAVLAHFGFLIYHDLKTKSYLFDFDLQPMKTKEFGNVGSRPLMREELKYICAGIFDYGLSFSGAKYGRGFYMEFEDKKLSKIVQTILLGSIEFEKQPELIFDAEKSVYRLMLYVEHAEFMKILAYTMNKSFWNFMIGSTRWPAKDLESKAEAKHTISRMNVWTILGQYSLGVRMLSLMPFRVDAIRDMHMTIQNSDNVRFYIYSWIPQRPYLFFVDDMEILEDNTKLYFDYNRPQIETYEEPEVSLFDPTLPSILEEEAKLLDLENEENRFKPIGANDDTTSLDAPIQKKRQTASALPRLLIKDDVPDIHDEKEEWIREEEIDTTFTPMKPADQTQYEKAQDEKFDIKELKEDPLYYWRKSSGWEKESIELDRKLSSGAVAPGLVSESKKDLMERFNGELERRGLTHDDYNLIMGFLSGTERHPMAIKKGMDLYKNYVIRLGKYNYDKAGGM
jgi:hypothetical protein